jgi:cell division protein FtsB
MPQDDPADRPAPAPEPPRATRKRRGKGLIILLFVACVLVLNALVGEKGLLAILQARRQYRELAASLEDVRQENARLREEARRLREDPAAIEEIARRELGFIKPGEKVFTVKDARRPYPRPKTGG